MKWLQKLCRKRLFQIYENQIVSINIIKLNITVQIVWPFLDDASNILHVLDKPRILPSRQKIECKHHKPSQVFSSA